MVVVAIVDIPMKNLSATQAHGLSMKALAKRNPIAGTTATKKPVFLPNQSAKNPAASAPANVRQRERFARSF